ncbi:MAG: tail protein X [Pseudomonadota bacterium]
MATIRAQAGDTLELLVFRHYGKQDHATLTAVMDANPGIADHGLFLPAGLEVVVPVLTVDEPQRVLARVQELWS